MQHSIWSRLVPLLLISDQVWPRCLIFSPAQPLFALRLRNALTSRRAVVAVSYRGARRLTLGRLSAAVTLAAGRLTSAVTRWCTRSPARSLAGPPARPLAASPLAPQRRAASEVLPCPPSAYFPICRPRGCSLIWPPAFAFGQSCHRMGTRQRLLRHTRCSRGVHRSLASRCHRHSRCPAIVHPLVCLVLCVFLAAAGVAGVERHVGSVLVC